MASESDSDVKIMHLSQSTGDVAEREFVLKLIALYRENPVLWNSNDEHYSNKYRRIVALKKICGALKPFKPRYTIEELKKKLNILRTNFNKERNKIELRKSLSPDEKKGPILWYYNEMAFLIGEEMPAKKSVATTESIQTKLLQNLKRKKISVFAESSTSSSFKKPENEEEILAKCWAIKLRKLAPDQRLYAEKIINDTLFEGEMGTLTRHGVSFNTAPEVWTQYSTESRSPEYKPPPP